MCMECLARVELAYRDTFQIELSQCVSTFKEIVGELQDYTGRPMLMTWTQESPYITMKVADLEIERFLEATHVT